MEMAIHVFDFITHASSKQVDLSCYQKKLIATNAHN